jgi:hypothetical protein
MKKIVLFFAAATILSLGLVSCNNNSAKSTAETFLNGLYHYDYEAAKSVSTEETKKMVDLMAQFSAMMPDSVKQDAKKVKVDIKDVKEEGDKATVSYTLSDDPAERKLNLVKQDKKWLVQYSKMDGNMGEGNPDANAGDTVPIEEPTTAPPADGTAADTTHQH